MPPAWRVQARSGSASPTRARAETCTSTCCPSPRAPRPSVGSSCPSSGHCRYAPLDTSVLNENLDSYRDREGVYVCTASVLQGFGQSHAKSGGGTGEPASPTQHSRPSNSRQGGQGKEAVDKFNTCVLGREGAREGMTRQEVGLAKQAPMRILLSSQEEV